MTPQKSDALPLPPGFPVPARPASGASAAALAWVLAAAFADAGPGDDPIDLIDPVVRLGALDAEARAAAADLARGLDLAARIASRLGRDRLEALFGDDAGTWLAARTRTAARGVALLEGAKAVAGIAREAGVPLAWLKFAGLAAAGVEVLGRRGASDLDLLVPEERVETLAGAVAAAGFAASAAPAPEHQAAALAHPTLGAVEIHRYLSGIPRGASRFSELERAGRLEAGDAVAPGTFVPARAVLAAHALAHGRVQHGLTADYPHFRIFGDLIDLGFGVAGAGGDRGDGGDDREEWARELAPGAGAALALVAALRRGELPRRDAADRTERAAALELDHFLALATSSDYGAALKPAAAWRSTGERGAPARLLHRLRRLVLLSRAEVEAIYGPQPGAAAVLGRRLLRPFDLAGRALAARRARRRLSGRGRDPEGS